MAKNIRPLDETTAATIRERAFDALPRAATARTHLALSPVVYPKGHVFDLVDDRLVVPRESALVFVDELPGANWGHPCRYQFFDPSSGELVREQRALFPPDLTSGVPRLEAFHTPLAFAERPQRRIYKRTDWRTTYRVPNLKLGRRDDRWAVLWSSQISNRRHVEDLELLYRTLTGVYGFSASRIKVLCYDGTLGSTDFDPLGDYVGDNTAYKLPIDRSATRENLQATFDEIAPRLTESSLLFVHTNNHGSENGLCIDSSSVITPAEWGTMLAGLPAIDALVVTMEQCFSGAFQQDTIDSSTAARTVFASAVPADKSSAGAAHFDPWARHLIEAFAGATAYGAALPSDPDVNHHGGVSIKEAYDYALARNDNTLDDPRYADSPAGCGQDIYLGRLSSIPDWLKGLLEGVQEDFRIPIPDPGPLRSSIDLVRQGTARHLVALAKSLSPTTIELPDAKAKPRKATRAIDLRDTKAKPKARTAKARGTR